MIMQSYLTKNASVERSCLLLLIIHGYCKIKSLLSLSRSDHVSQ